MISWDVIYTDGHVEKIEADGINIGGTVAMFIEHSRVATPDGQPQGSPIAFIDVSNPSVRGIRKTPGQDDRSAGLALA